MDIEVDNGLHVLIHARVINLSGRRLAVVVKVFIE